MKNRRAVFALILLAVFLLGGLAYLFAPRQEPATESPVASTGNITKEGEVVFWQDGNRVCKIDVEIAENEAERNKGLMYRSSIPDSTGMLFIFETAEPQGFWMKNTIIPLDIIYVDENKKIVSIARNTKPYSEESIPSYGNAKYVVEVNAGFSERYNLKSGDAISF